MTGNLAKGALVAWLAACHAPAPRVVDGAACPVKECEHVTVVDVDPTFTPAEHSEIHRAMAAWTYATGGRACFVELDGGVPIVRVEKREELKPYDKDWSDHVGLHVPKRLATTQGRIFIVAGELGASQVGDVAAHELGHHFGIDHLSGVESVLLWANGTRGAGGSLHQADREAYCATVGCRCR